MTDLRIGSRTVTKMTMYRLVIGALGVALGLFGVYRLLTQVQNPQLISIGEWIIGAIVLHDAILSPVVVGVGYLLTFVPPRIRKYVQGAVIAGCLVTALGIVFVIYVDTNLLTHQIAGGGNLGRASTVTRETKSILTQNYGAHLVELLAIVIGVSVLLYVRRVVLDARSRPASGAAVGGTRAATELRSPDEPTAE